MFVTCNVRGDNGQNNSYVVFKDTKVIRLGNTNLSRFFTGWEGDLENNYKDRNR